MVAGMVVVLGSHRPLGKFLHFFAAILHLRLMHYHLKQVCKVKDKGILFKPRPHSGFVSVFTVFSLRTLNFLMSVTYWNKTKNNIFINNKIVVFRCVVSIEGQSRG